MKKTLAAIFIAMLTLFCSVLIAADSIDEPKRESGASAKTTPSEWAKEDVEKALELGILDADKTYYYGSFITREEFCEIVDALVKTTEVLEDQIVLDCDSEEVKKLVALEIINGKAKTDKGITFCPDDLLTREEAAVIFSRIINKSACGLSFTDDEVIYDDNKDISQWAYDGIQLVSKSGLMQGYNGVFYPKSHLSTEEAIVVVVRAYELIEKVTVADDKTTFADKINAQMQGDKNYMFSPLSIKMALALAANGAEGETKEEILGCMQISDIENYNELSKKLVVRYSGSDNLTLSIANSVWVNTDNCPHDFKDSYKNTVSEFYNAEAGQVNNSNAVAKVNGWVNENTGGKIPSIINDSDFWAALVNAIYFKGSWEKDFSAKRTQSDIFNNADGTKTEIDFMNQTDRFSYAKNDEAEIIELRYTPHFDEDSTNNVKASMYLVKTKNTDVERLIKNADFTSTRVKLSVPKFEVEYSDEITKYLNLTNSTDRLKADFSGMINLSPDEDLWIDKILHKTFISVDENGTEAAAATAVMMAGAASSMPEEPIEVKFDEPFYFVIRDEINGEILFMGRYAYAE